MMTRYEIAKAFLEAENLPPKQTDNLGVLEGQVLKFAQDLYTMTPRNIEAASLEEAKEIAKGYFTSIKGAAVFLLIVGADIHHFRMASLSRYLEVPPEMQIDDIISRLTTRECDTAHNDAIGDVVLSKVENKEKGKEEGKEEKPPHTPLKEKGKEEIQKEPLSRARVKVRKDDPAFKSFFDRFWAKYPRKVGKLKAKKGLFAYWKKRKRRADFENEVLTSLEKWCACEQWKDPMYIPHPSTWVNQKRWMVDEGSISLRRPFRRVSGVSQTANVKSNRAKGLW